MPNITKYMGKAIPGMNVIKGAWDAGQGVDSLVKALQRLAAKQSGGPVPMKDIEDWYQRTQAGGSEARSEGSRYQTSDLHMGFKEKPMSQDILDLLTENTGWNDDIAIMVRALQELKEYQKKREKRPAWGKRNYEFSKDVIKHKLKEYIDTPKHLSTSKVKHKAKARDSIWMSVLDAMKKREQEKEYEEELEKEYHKFTSPFERDRRQ